MPAKAEMHLADLKEEVARAQAPSPLLMARFIKRACMRIAMPGCAGRAARINQLIEMEAWTEAALELIELEALRWKLRRLVCEEGLWLCSLSKQWNLPDWLADSAESRHETLPLAILSALIEVRQWGEPSAVHTTSSVPQCRGPSGSSETSVVCCDNFA
jgi:hypothetical protein